MSDYNSNSVGSAQFNYYNNLTLSEGPSKLIREELKKAAMGKYAKLLELLGAKSGKGMKGLKGMDIRDQLMILLEVVLADMDKQILGKIKELSKLSAKMKKMTKKQAENSPGLASGYNTDSSIIQTELTMLTQNRQRFVEAINNALKAFHDGDSNTIRRMV